MREEVILNNQNKKCVADRCEIESIIPEPSPIASVRNNSGGYTRLQRRRRVPKALPPLFPVLPGNCNTSTENCTARSEHSSSIFPQSPSSSPSRREQRPTAAERQKSCAALTQSHHIFLPDPSRPKAVRTGKIASSVVGP